MQAMIRVRIMPRIYRPLSLHDDDVEKKKKKEEMFQSDSAMQVTSRKAKAKMRCLVFLSFSLFMGLDPPSPFASLFNRHP